MDLAGLASRSIRLSRITEGSHLLEKNPHKDYRSARTAVALVRQSKCPRVGEVDQSR